jgi:prephenate dehydrogenase
MRIAVVGAGKMGRWFARFFMKEGESVIVSDKNRKALATTGKELQVETGTNLRAITEADRILICVPFEKLEGVVKEIHPLVQPDQVIMDICSIKEAPVEIMHRYIKQATVLGTHPIFGPGVKSMANQNIVLTPINRKERQLAQAFEHWLENRSASVSIMSPRKHDEFMSVVLGLPHFIGLAVCETLLDYANFAEMERVAGPSYRMLLMFAKAIASEQAEFYASLQMNLPETTKIERAFLNRSTDWLKLIKRKDSKTFVRRMDNLKTKLENLNSDLGLAYDTMQRMIEMSRM